MDVGRESDSRALVIEQSFLKDLNLEAEDNIGKETWNESVNHHKMIMLREMIMLV